MATITTRSGKGSALTFAEMDANFTNINNELANVAAGQVANNSISNAEIDNTDDFTFNSVSIASAYTLPTTDGTTGQVLTTDGNGNVTFSTVVSGGGQSNVSVLSDLDDVDVTGTSAGHIMIANGGSVFLTQPVSGDATLDQTGNLQLAANVVGNVEIDNTADIVANTFTATGQFEGDINGAVMLLARNVSGGTIYKGQAVYVNGLSGDTPTVILADASDPAKMPALGVARANINNNATGEIVTLGSLYAIDTSLSNQLETGITLAVGDVLYVSSTEPGNITNAAPTGESNQIQNIGKAVRVSPNTNMTFKIHGAGRSAATPALNEGNIFIGNSSNQATTTPFAVSLDATPQLGGNLDVDGNHIVSVSSDINLTPDGNLTVTLDNTNDWYLEGSSRMYIDNTVFGSGIAVSSKEQSNAAGFGMDAFSFANISFFGGKVGGQKTDYIFSPASPLAAYGDNSNQKPLGVLKKFEWKDSGDWTAVTDAATTANSNVVLSASNAFVNAEVGDFIRIEGAGPSTSTAMSGNLAVLITAVNDSGNIEIADRATNTGTYDAYLLEADETAIEWRAGAGYGKHVERHYATQYGSEYDTGNAESVGANNENVVDYEIQAKNIILNPDGSNVIQAKKDIEIASGYRLTGEANVEIQSTGGNDVIITADDDLDLRASDNFQFRNLDSDTAEYNETVTLIHQRQVTPQGSATGVVVESSDDKVGSDYPTQLVIRRNDEGDGPNTAHSNISQRIASYDLTLEAGKSTLSLNYVDDDNTGTENNSTTLMKFKNSSSETANAATQSAPDTIELGANLDVNGNQITASSNGNITMATTGAGQLVLDVGTITTTTDANLDISPNGTGVTNLQRVRMGDGDGGIQLEGDQFSDMLAATRQTTSHYSYSLEVASDSTSTAIAAGQPAGAFGFTHKSDGLGAFYVGSINGVVGDQGTPGSAGENNNAIRLYTYEDNSGFALNTVGEFRYASAEFMKGELTFDYASNKITIEAPTSGNDIELKTNGSGYIILSNLPTSSAGLPTGAVWNDSGTLKIA